MILMFLIFFLNICLNVFGSNNENTSKLEIYCDNEKIFEHAIFKKPVPHYYSHEAMQRYFYLKKEGKGFETTENGNYWDIQENIDNTKTTFVFKVFDSNGNLVTLSSLPLFYIDFVRCSIYPTIKSWNEQIPFGTKVEIVKYTPKSKWRKRTDNFLIFMGIVIVSLSLSIALAESFKKQNKNVKNSDI